MCLTGFHLLCFGCRNSEEFVFGGRDSRPLSETMWNNVFYRILNELKVKLCFAFVCFFFFFSPAHGFWISVCFCFLHLVHPLCFFFPPSYCHPTPPTPCRVQGLKLWLQWCVKHLRNSPGELYCVQGMFTADGYFTLESFSRHKKTYSAALWLCGLLDKFTKVRAKWNDAEQSEIYTLLVRSL